MFIFWPFLENRHRTVLSQHDNGCFFIFIQGRLHKSCLIIQLKRLNLRKDYLVLANQIAETLTTLFPFIEFFLTVPINSTRHPTHLHHNFVKYLS